MTDVDLARQLAYIAGDLDRRMYPYAGVIRRAARALVLVATDQPTPDRCRGCEAPIVQPSKGRPRTWCSEACRSRHRRRRPATDR